MGHQTLFLRKAGAPPPTTDTLSDDITELVLARIVYLSLFIVGLATIGTLTCLIKSHLEGAERHPGEYAPQAVMAVIALTSAWLVHGRKLAPKALVRIGQGLGILVAIWFESGELFSIVVEQFEWYSYSSFNAIWVVFFPAIMPIRLRTSMITVLLIAAIPTTSRALAQSAGWVDLPDNALVNLTLLMAFAAAMGMCVSHVVYSLGKSVKAAREMGSYTLEKSLGKGGMGTVWRASHRMLARPAAVKLINPDVFVGLGPDQVTRLKQRFEHEVQSTAALFSPHTVDIYDYGVASDGIFFYVMELLEGIDMESLVERFGPVEPSRVSYLLTQACHSLSEANNRQMIHRDIKPANLFLCKYGDDFDFVKVLDFGLVKRGTMENKQGLNLTGEGSVAGTPAYMSPEAALGKRRLDHRSDLYSLGCVGYRLLTGRLPFHAETPMAMLVEHVNAEPVPPSSISEVEIPAAFESVILDCLAKDPDDRPQTAGELARRLRKIEFRRSWDQEQARKWWEAHRPV